MNACLFNVLIGHPHLPVHRKEETYSDLIVHPSNPVQEHDLQRRHDEKIFATYAHPKFNAAGSKEMIEPEPKDLAETILRAVQAGRLGKDAGEKKVSRPLQVLGARIRALRREKGISLAELSERTDIDEDLLLAIELGIASPMLVYKNLQILGDALGGYYPELSRLLIRVTLKI